MLSKRIIVCCDGTWKDLSKKGLTNVVKIAQAIKPIDREGKQQIVYYHEGIGVADLLDRVVGGAFGWGIDKHIQDAYRFLCLNYTDDDEVYLFGFSRGAYTVRSLAGLIYKCGLLPRDQIGQAQEAYEFYRNSHPPNSEQSIKFRQDLNTKQIPIELLCCWDTVGALGIPNTIPVISKLVNQPYEFHDTQINRKIQNALHAVAIDERRKAFSVTSMDPSDNADTKIGQVWFVGDHSCVGGGIESSRGLSDITLQWIINEIDQLELGLDFFEDEELRQVIGDFEPDLSVEFKPQISFVYRLTELTGLGDRTLLNSTDPALEEVFFQSNIHESVKRRWKKKINPPQKSKNLERFKLYFEAFEVKF